MNLLKAINSMISPQAFADGLSGTWFAVGAGFVVSFVFCLF
jgi:hypothetical protein